MQREITDLVDRYVSLTNAALAGEPDMAAIGDLYDEAFIGSSPAGVMAGSRDEEFRKALAAGFARNREIGARQMEILNLRIEPLDTLHALAHVDWRATYDSYGKLKEIDFINVYLTRVSDGRARVFGWITGDETGELRKHGIL